ncbi:hypothetical protein GWO43_17035, partial [candidate division KSB1 bacterium]|nr:hypothetical protein [candidate division KSB1 bacterium]NIR69168.1 hypothetical protein [candidate division KSB1 bacterium]NIS25679.1 hypothetical protein [candidate division KSB1 bacterium]NIT72547.1 hypothetical protein [candidate division KSB1 bacterium]NIU26356.1 hypothetical protein [candidate division KSB1 bacterium]
MKRNDHFVLPLLLHFAAIGFVLSCGPGEVQTEGAIQSSTAKPFRTGEAAQSPPQIHLKHDSESPDFGTIEVRKLPKDLLAELRKLKLNDRQWRTLLPTFTGDAFPTNQDEKPAMLGRYEIDGDVIRFRPRFQFEAGLTYFTRLDLTYLNKLIDISGISLTTDFVDHSFSIPEKEANATTFVKAVYPTSHQLPENLLKFYLYFSAPMSQADVHRHIRLLNFN